MQEKAAGTLRRAPENAAMSHGTPEPARSEPAVATPSRPASSASRQPNGATPAFSHKGRKRRKLSSLNRLFAVSPRAIYRVLSRPDMLATKLQKPRESSPREFIHFLFGQGPAVAARYAEYHHDFVADHRFFHELNERMVARRDRRVWGIRWGELMYLIVRFHQPEVMIETGVFDGISSSMILKGLADNKRGRLYSIDLPAVDSIEGSTDRMLETTLPRGCQPGWLVPDYLRDRYDVAFADARVELPGLLDRVKNVDIFFHDSLHTYEHMAWEFETAWPFLRPGGLVLSDDIFWNPAFHRFARSHGRSYRHFRNLGGLRK